MTAKMFRYRPSAGGALVDDDIAATERAALLDQPCPPNGNPFTHVRVRHDVLIGIGRGREVWERHRKEILSDPKALTPGMRPAAFWQYDSPPDAPRAWSDDSHEPQARYLHAHSLLTAAERKRLPKEWFAPSTPILKVIA